MSLHWGYFFGWAGRRMAFMKKDFGIRSLETSDSDDKIFILRMRQADFLPSHSEMICRTRRSTGWAI